MNTVNIKNEVSYIINRKLSTYKDILCSLEEPNLISIPENHIYHIKLIDELLKYYKKEDIVIYHHNYKRKINPKKDFSITLNTTFRIKDIYDIYEPVSLISIDIRVHSKNSNFYSLIRYFFDEKTTQLPNIQFCVSWGYECSYYDYNFQGFTQIQEDYTTENYIYSELLNPYKISEIVTSFVEINEELEPYFENVSIENLKLKKMSDIIWITLSTLITKKIGDKFVSFYGVFENKTLLLYFSGEEIARFEINVENYDSKNFDTIIKDIEKLVNFKDSNNNYNRDLKN